VLIQLLVIASGIISFYTIIPVLLINSWMLVKNLSLVKKTHEVTSKSLYLLQPYTEMIRNMEEAHFEHAKLQALKNKLLSNGKTASGEIRSLTRILSLFDSRSNMLYGILNAFFLIDINVLLLAENWRSKSGNKVPEWLDAVSEMEALNSLAGFARANPGYGFPAIASQAHVFEMFAMGHPLIAAEKRVNNDFTLQGAGSIAIITGSNMAGKSTFLRTVGINTVLALAGAPVCATKSTISPFRVYSSMRTKDNLEENISSFYAELLRINQLLSEAGKPGDPVFFLLDELLKGTNSEDRHKGSEALIRQLNEMDTMGLVSTHDLELGKLADSIPSVKNFSFNSYFEGDELIFDYKLSEGLCKSFNASRLMEKMGIRLM
jgi:DNA mismatch repair ATPase MutS